MEKKSKPFAKKSLGQNFLIDERVVERIVSALELEPGDVVLEIGPGQGALTGKILESCQRLFLVEKDDRFAAELESRFATDPAVQVFHADFLEFDFGRIGGINGLKVVGNLPYNVGTAILHTISRHRLQIERAVFMLQREVVERIAAPASTSERGFLSVVSQYSFAVEKLFDVSPGSFRPSPKVTSAVIRLKPRISDLTEEVERILIKIVSAAFAQRRKTIFNNLKNLCVSGSEAVAQCLYLAGIEKDRRAESLSVDEWVELAQIWHGSISSDN
jgi:16S rRNA (adenine1518-N6/adenine1519-N6)-dimethyltransferase